MKCGKCNKNVVPVEKTTKDANTTQKKNKNSKYVVKNSGSLYQVTEYDDNFIAAGRKMYCYQCYKKVQDERNEDDNIFYTYVKKAQGAL